MTDEQKKKSSKRSTAAEKAETTPPETQPEQVAETTPPEPPEIDIFQQIAHDAQADVALLDEALGAVGTSPVEIDKTKPTIKIAVPWGVRMPSQEHPMRGTFVSVFCQPLTNGHMLIEYRGAEIYMANRPEDVEAESPVKAGAIILTSGYSYRDKQTNRLRNVSVGGCGINQQGFRFFFCTTAAVRKFESLGTPLDDEDNLTSLNAQAKGSTLLSRLHSAARQWRIEQARARNEGKQQPGGTPAHARPPSTPMSTGGDSGEQQLPHADFDD
jgi:hypothetical protein